LDDEISKRFQQSPLDASFLLEKNKTKIVDENPEAKSANISSW
jgi:hypothetical protein